MERLSAFYYIYTHANYSSLMLFAFNITSGEKENTAKKDDGRMRN